jgi:hypothetical protein
VEREISFAWGVLCIQTTMPKQQWEEEARDRFLQFLSNRYAEAWVVLDEDVVVDPVSNRNFDYQLGLGDRRMALELFRLVNDQEELARDKVWSEVVHLLERELAQRSLKGYVLNTPPYFKVPRVKREEFAKNLADRIEKLLEANPGADEIAFDAFSLGKVEGLERIACGAIGEGGAVNPTGIALAALEEKLPDKNSQLAINGHERVIVVVNWAYLVGTDDVVEATSQLGFDHFPNIEKVYFEVAQDNFQLVFDKSLFAAFDSGGSASNAELDSLYTRWLAFRLERKDARAFDLVKKLAAERDGLLWLPALSRVEVVRYGEGFIKGGNWENVAWIVRNFKNDPDPSIENAADDPEGKLNAHRKTECGDCVRFIISVRGHLCWLMNAIVSANRPDLYEEVLNIVEGYAVGPNLYLRQQATIPLSALARRRGQTREGQPYMKASLEARIRPLILRMLSENAAYPCVLEWLASAITTISDMSPAEAEDVLTIFLRNPTDDTARFVAGMLIFYGIFREKQKGKLGAFDATRLSQLLKTQIVCGLATIRADIAWQMSQILDTQPGEGEAVVPYACLLPSGEYERSAFFHFYKIAAKHMKTFSSLLGPALKQALGRESQFHGSNEQQSIWDFDRQRLPALKDLLDCGRVDDFLDCVEIILGYRKRIFNFPAASVQELLMQTQSERAQNLKEQLESEA